ncbi:protein kinase [Novymonas esmeraldas]|uniref:non-specific serine/threonine protein kinase n=1 Tax=Novymonas esmeraldas TaxID=1808958 RepID=A0AAW0EP11_9TRYP
MNPSSKRRAHEPLPSQQQQQQQPGSISAPSPSTSPARDGSAGGAQGSASLPHLSPSAVPVAGGAVVPPAAAQASLVPLRQARGGSPAHQHGGHAAVSQTYPGASGPVGPATMALAVVPFTGTGTGDAGTRQRGELAPLSMGAQRVCPHCRRPYNNFHYPNVDDDDDDGIDDDMFGAASLLRANPAAISPSHLRLLPPPPPPPPAQPQPLQQPPPQQQQQQQVRDGPSYSPSAALAGTDDDSRRGSTHVAAAHPPTAAFTAPYFRALPPPALIAAAVAGDGGASPLAIEDYHPTLLLDSPQVPKEEADAEEVGQSHESGRAGGDARATSDNAVVCHTTASSFFSYVSPTTRTAARSSMRLLRPQHTDDIAVAEMDEAPSPAHSPVRLDDSAAAAEAQSFNNGYYSHYFTEVRQLGRGTFGGVYLCRHILCGIHLGEFAVKKIPVGDKAAYLQSVLREVRILEEVRRHPNVVEYKHSWVEEAQLADFGPPVRCLFVLMEYASAGSLDAYLDRFGARLSTLAVWYFFLSAVAGTAHLHEKRILHRDLKPQNLLLAAAKDRPPRVLVSDFGTAALLEDVSYERSGGTGTLEYMAPELFQVASSPRGQRSEYVNHHTMASDVWSLGMVLHFLAFDGVLPERRADGSVDLGAAHRSPLARPPEMLRLLEAMLQLDPAQRPRCSDILGSTMVQSILRVFNRDDHTQWDLSVQQQQQQQQHHQQQHQKISAVAPVALLPLDRGPRPPVPAVPPHVEVGAPPRNRSSITVISASSPSGRGPPVRRPHEGEERSALSSSRVELLSTSAMVDLPTIAVARGGSGVGGAGGGRRSSVLTPGASHRYVSSHSPEVVAGSPRTRLHSTTRFGDSPPPSRQTADAAVQTDPVKLVDL